MRRFSLVIVAAVCSVWAASAQQNNSQYEIGGVLFSADAMSTSDMLSISQTQFSFGTARSMAMAGAFTSLGADLSSMAINPAGLGMYRNSDISITPLMTLGRSSTNAMPYQGNSKNRFSVGNFGVAINTYEGTGALTSLTLGFGYNRLTDLNYQYSMQYAGSNMSTSIADALSVQLEYGGIGVTDKGIITDGNNLNWNIDPFFWNGVAGYKTFLLDRNQNGVWYPGEIGNNALINGGATVVSTGSVGEFDISMGANFGNKFYFGATIGIQSIHQRKTYYYGEEYLYNDDAVDSDGNPLPGNVMQSMGMAQTSTLSGAGVNLKLGFIYRPTESLRIGVSFHTPTFYSLDRTYYNAMSTMSIGATSDTDPTPHEWNSDTESPELRDENETAWKLWSPSRLLVGVSYSFGSVGVISVDYQRDWYNGIRVKNMPYLAYGMNEGDFKNDFKNYFKGSNTLRVGAEIRPVPFFAIRAGFGYSGSILKEKDVILSTPAIYETMYYSAGVGFSLGSGVYLDLAYSYTQNKQTEYFLYYGNRYDMSDAANDEIYTSDRYKTDLNRHNIALTFGFRF